MKETEILLIEDNPDDAVLVTELFSRCETRFVITHVERLADGLDRLEKQRFDVAIVDLSLPDSLELEAVTRIKQRMSGLPIIVLTGLANDATAIDSINHGAQDYLVKGRVTTESLEQSIRYAIQRQQSRSEIEQLLTQVQAHEKQLGRKNKRLRRLYKTAHEFVDNVSHEFRTPLTVIKEYTSLLREGLLGEINAEQCRYLDVINDRADDLNNMVNDMLDVSRLKSELLGAWRKSCRVSEIVEYIRPSLERKALVRNVSLTFTTDEDLPEVYCDPEKIGRVITNLAINAIKFCGELSTVQIWTRLQAETDDVLIGVTDSGGGIDKEKLQAIFERFKQLGQDTASSTKGFGLGLNIAKQLVELNFGEIYVESERGRGSTFSFTVPLDHPAEITRRYLRQIALPHCGYSVVSSVRGRVDDAVEPAECNEANAFLNSLLRRDDLLFRIDKSEWLLLLPIGSSDLGRFLQRAAEVFAKTNRNRPQGPLPEMDLNPDVTWPIPESHDEIVSYVKTIQRQPEMVHA